MCDLKLFIENLKEGKIICFTRLKERQNNFEIILSTRNRTKLEIMY
jgi:hypothetical protein